MQILLWLLSFSFTITPPVRLTIIDMNLVQPAREETDFTAASYFKRRFPINSTDVLPVIDAAGKAARLLDSKRAFTTDTLLNAGTTFIITTNNDESKTITVRLITSLEGGSTTFAFDLLKKESDRRKAQRKLVEFGAYLQK